MKTADFDYYLPASSIAQTPIEPRDTSRLFVLDRQTGRIQHRIFRDLGEFLRPDDILVLNETRVIPARLLARKMPTGGKVEILLLKKYDDTTWDAIVGGKGLTNGKRLRIDFGPEVEIVDVLHGAERLIRFDEPIEPYLSKAGHLPLPPYIHANLSDPNRYQTVYSRVVGSSAAPTAGLHFTLDLIEALSNMGVHFTKVILHVGLDTFAPVTVNDPVEHLIHTEWCQIGQAGVLDIRSAKENGGRVIAVGTTSVRVLESAANMSEPGDYLVPFEGPTSLYILPGYQFKLVDGMITNFHLPRSTLLMLVSAFANRELILASYSEAISSGYRFYSFGDAMFIT